MRLLPLLLLGCASPPDAPLHDLLVVGMARTPEMKHDSLLAIFVNAGRIVAVMPLEEALEGPRRARRTVRGDRVTLGFVDAHAHTEGLGARLERLDLVGTQSLADVLARVREAPAASDWLRGRGWDQNDWSDQSDWPTAADLDAVTGERPTALTRIDGHAIWLNTAALQVAGITADTPDPEGGTIVRDPSTGQPTGVLIDNAMGLVPLPKPSRETRKRRLQTGMERMISVGLTGVHDMGVDDEGLALYRELEASGALPLRVNVFVDPGTEAATALHRAGPQRGERLSVVGIKAYADGALGSRGALLTQPYSDAADHHGLAVTSSGDLVELAKATLGAGGILAVHAIGDAGVRGVLDAFEAARRAHPTQKATPLRLEHAQVVHPRDQRRLAPLRVVASMQPTHATSDMPWAAERLGPVRVAWAYAWRDLQEKGVTLALGSDAPVESVDPALGIWAATTRTDLAGQPEGGWRPDQRLNLDATIHGFTTGADVAVGNVPRSLAVGEVADLTIWRSGEARPPLRAHATVIDGVVVWEAAEPPAP